jgi:hypothetical protein
MIKSTRKKDQERYSTGLGKTENNKHTGAEVEQHAAIS